MTDQEKRTMEVLAQCQTATFSAVGHALSITPTAAKEIVTDLMTKGLVEIEGSRCWMIRPARKWLTRRWGK